MPEAMVFWKIRISHSSRYHFKSYRNSSFRKRRARRGFSTYRMGDSPRSAVTTPPFWRFDRQSALPFSKYSSPDSGRT